MLEDEVMPNKVRHCIKQNQTDETGTYVKRRTMIEQYSNMFCTMRCYMKRCNSRHDKYY